MFVSSDHQPQEHHSKWQTPSRVSALEASAQAYRSTKKSKLQEIFGAAYRNCTHPFFNLLTVFVFLRSHNDLVRRGVKRLVVRSVAMLFIVKRSVCRATSLYQRAFSYLDPIVIAYGSKVVMVVDLCLQNWVSQETYVRRHMPSCGDLIIRTSITCFASVLAFASGRHGCKDDEENGFPS